MAVLDITLGQWVEWLHNTPEPDEEVGGPEVGDTVAQMIDALQENSPASAHRYVQGIAMLSDDSLRKVVTSVTGKDPLESAGEV